MTKKISISLVASFLIATNSNANEPYELTVTSNTFDIIEQKAPFSTEIYTQEDIKKSNSKNIYDFLNSQTSVIALPNSGNELVQKIDLRGFGIGDGYQNIVVTLNGRRLNNIDMVPQLLSSISIDDIEKIEIIKGSGSVKYGDGSTAGTINIITNAKNTNMIKTSYGSNNTKNSTVSLGYNNDHIILNGMLDYLSSNGSRHIDTTGKTDTKWVKNKNINLSYFPTDSLELFLGKSFLKMDNQYSNGLTLNEYENDASKFGTTGTTGTSSHVLNSSYITSTGIKYQFSDKLSFEVNGSKEDKTNENKTYDFEAVYDYKNINSNLKYQNDIYGFLVGFDKFDGERFDAAAWGQPDRTTSKNNQSYFISSNLTLDNNTFNAGLRRENIQYIYSPVGLQEQNAQYWLNGYEVGVNHQFTDKLSIFTNYTKSFQAPDIDRFFNWGGTFNEFIEPMTAKTFNLGLNHITDDNQLKVTLFKTKLDNEIYYYKINAWSGRNTNIDKSHKHGIEIYDKYNINQNIFVSANYNYIVAKIDSENEANGAYNGKYLPGVSKHNLTLNLGYDNNSFSAMISQKYRSKAYAMEDFSNSFSQKQDSYKSTDLSFGYKIKNLEFFAKIQNLFDERNGLWLRDNVIYPVNFERTYMVGLNAKF